MKKGFTLIELLAVIVILAVISLIAVPRIMDAIDDSRAGALRQNNEAVIKAVQNYFVDNAIDLPQVVGETTEISLEQLIQNDLINEISSPYSSDNCSGYVLVTKVEGGHDFIPHINCFEEINNSIDDGLLLHYNFKEQKESTRNAMNEASELRIGTWGAWGFGDGSAHTGHVLYNETFRGSNVLKVYRRDYHRYMTAVSASIVQPRLVIPAGESVTFSSYVKAGTENLVGLSIRLHIYGQRLGVDGNFSTGATAGYLTSSWNRIEATLTNTSENDWEVTNTYFRGNFNEDIEIDSYYLISSPQLELKPYSTPFVDGVRNEVIFDKSINDNKSTMYYENSPVWNDRAYSFNEDSYFVVNDIEVGGSRTTSYWVKPTLYKRVTGGLDSRSLNSQQIRVYGTSSLQPRLYDNNNTFHNFSNRYDASYLMGQWQMHTLTFDADTKEAVLYVNGKEVLSQVFSSYEDGNSLGSFAVGTQHDYLNQDTTIASYTNLRLYNRALSKAEVKQLYDLERR